MYSCTEIESQGIRKISLQKIIAFKRLDTLD